jgi:Tryptophan-associated transmembrane protein (Trp_oprn_chp)
MTAGRRLAVAVLCCAGAAGLAVFAASRTWATSTTLRPAPLPAIVTARTGADLLPILPALCLVAVAGAGALMATRGAPRAALGALLVLCGGGIVVSAGAAVLGGLADPGTGVTRHLSVLAFALAALCVAAGVVITTVGVLAVRHRASWPSLGARFERRGGTVPRTGQDQRLWDAFDRGEDPTAGEDGCDAAEGSRRDGSAEPG